MSALPAVVGVEHHFVRAGGVELHVAEPSVDGFEAHADEMTVEVIDRMLRSDGGPTGNDPDVKRRVEGEVI